MKISDHYQTSMVGAQNVGEKRRKELKAEEGKTATPSAVNVMISGKGQEVAKARNLAVGAPDVRQSLVDELNDQIDNGEYNVRGEDVAPKMIEEHMLLGS